MWTPGPFETRASRAMYYLTDADPSWPEERKLEHLRDFNVPTLWTISMHARISRALSPLSAPAARCLEGAPLDVVRPRLVRRGLGALLRADDAELVLGGAITP